MAAYTSFPCKALSGTITVPGDKSISHRSLMLASQAIGVTSIKGLLLGEDVLHTAQALQMLGVTIANDKEGVWHVDGVGVGGLVEPADLLNMGNSGTGARLMMGLVSPYPFTSFFTGDASLRSRPMARVAKPLEQMGVRCLTRSQCRLPLAVIGSDQLIPITYRLPVPSAQVKSALLFAGLNIAGTTTIIEPELTRDHTERMLRFFGFDLEETFLPDGAKAIALSGQSHQPKACHIDVPGDPSSAAFLAVAALITQEASILIENVCINPLRTGVYATLQEMGAHITFRKERMVAGEKVADIEVQSSTLKGVVVPAERAPSMIDEYPILAVAAAFAEGKTVMQGLSELKVKESNRLKAIAEGLAACGVAIEEGDDSLIVHGTSRPLGGGYVTTHMDHRIAMSFLVFGMASKEPVTVDDVAMINTSFPDFLSLTNGLGGSLKPSALHEKEVRRG